MDIDWNPIKNAELKSRHGYGFEDVLVAISEGGLLDERDQPNQVRYAHQRQWIVKLERYVWVVALVKKGDSIFLKTMFPSRKDTRDYLGGQHGKAEG